MTAVKTVDLPDNLTIANAESLHHDLEPLTNGTEDVILNGADVQRADTAGLQLIYVFIQTLQKSSASVSWSGASTALLDASEQLGLKSHLALDSF
ncbi:STAS domain-containing protein [Pseudomaricurvus alkylphenolicus]|uniref:STAS domain-containing protein n=1 Tax=Pseudomaricurvus alkylphenolicus TaxID=1306991 RepID=UPI00141F03F5|nr:STAS domain-containing protein [Pseudomaricurvus alkylphenolicus]